MTAGSIEDFSPGVVSTIHLGSKNLTVGGNNLTTTFGGTIDDTGGSLTKEGSGTLTLAGNNTYTGATTVNAGTLLVDGSITSATTVNSGGTLGGTGTVSNTVTVNAGGTFAPGTPGSPGTVMAVGGNLAFQSGALYLAQASSAGASRANVSTATLTGGSVQMAFTPGSYSLGQQYTILHAATAGALGGTRFASVNSNGFVAALGYSSNDQDVFVTLTGAALGAGAKLNQSQQTIAGTLNGFFNGGGTLTPNFASIFGLTGDNLAYALSQLSGEAAAGAQQGAFKLGGQFLNLMLDPLADGRGGSAGASGPALGFAPDRDALPEDVALAYAKITKAPEHKAGPERRWSAWGRAYGGTNKTGGDPDLGSHDLTARTAGFAAGMDYRVEPRTVVGFALAGGRTDWGLAQGFGGGSSDAVQAGIYGMTRSGPAYLAASLAFSNHWMSTERTAFGNRLTADFDAQSFGGRLEGGWRLGTPVIGITPYAALQGQSFHVPAYRETDVDGSGFGLSYSSHSTQDIRSELGARFEHVALVNATAVLALRGRLAWAHDWISDPSSATFQALPGASFIVNGAVPAQDIALASAGAELRLASSVTLAARFDGEFAENAQTYAGTGTLSVIW
jgi:autotransporter-associated beta strand protein